MGGIGVIGVNYWTLAFLILTRIDTNYTKKEEKNSINSLNLCQKET